MSNKPAQTLSIKDLKKQLQSINEELKENDITLSTLEKVVADYKLMMMSKNGGKIQIQKQLKQLEGK